MSKRTSGQFKRRAQDAYDTPESAVLPLLPYLAGCQFFAEPCAGDGAIVRALAVRGVKCGHASDIAPRHKDIWAEDALTWSNIPSHVDLIITNPPWTRRILHPMIDHFRSMAPTWLLFDADWAHTKQAIPYLEYCHRIVSVGRVSWMQNGTSGFDNCAWYLFDKDPAETVFTGRVAA